MPTRGGGDNGQSITFGGGLLFTSSSTTDFSVLTVSRMMIDRRRLCAAKFNRRVSHIIIIYGRA